MSRIEWSALRARHRLATLVRRCGIDVPFDTGDIVICCPMPGHDDSTPSMVLHLDTERYYCFGCGSHGDVIQWIRDFHGVAAIEAARILDEDRQLRTTATVPSRVVSGRSDGRPASTGRARPERPDLARTPSERVRAALAAAWTYYSHSYLHRRGSAFLSARRIEVTALELEVGHAVIGHTPARRDGLVTHLREHGFRLEELVDASLACRYGDVRCFDFFRNRAILPIRESDGRLSGLIGRASTNTGCPKYLNMSRTHTYDKRIALYRPVTQALDRHANVIVCEGTIDALALSAQAAASGLSDRYAPVSASGLALSANQLHQILSIHPLPPVFGGDGDVAGRRASIEWATRAALASRESVITTWPDGHDPASWIAAYGEAGLLAVTRKGCLDSTDICLRPHHAGEIIARAALEQATSGVVSLEGALTVALAPHDHLQGAAAARYVSAVAKTFAPFVSTSKFETLQQQCTDAGRLPRRRERSWAPADRSNASECPRKSSRDVVTP